MGLGSSWLRRWGARSFSSRTNGGNLREIFRPGSWQTPGSLLYYKMRVEKEKELCCISFYYWWFQLKLRLRRCCCTGCLSSWWQVETPNSLSFSHFVVNSGISVLVSPGDWVTELVIHDILNQGLILGWKSGILLLEIELTPTRTPTPLFIFWSTFRKTTRWVVLTTNRAKGLALC